MEDETGGTIPEGKARRKGDMTIDDINSMERRIAILELQMAVIPRLEEKVDALMTLIQALTLSFEGFRGSHGHCMQNVVPDLDSRVKALEKVAVDDIQFRSMFGGVVNRVATILTTVIAIGIVALITWAIAVGFHVKVGVK